jgi:hypothetical protein
MFNHGINNYYVVISVLEKAGLKKGNGPLPEM